MQFDSNMNFSWGKDTPTKDHVEVDLDLQLSDIFKTRDIAGELLHNREQVRKEIFGIAADLLKKGIVDQGQLIQVPDGTSTETRTHAKAKHEFLESSAGLAMNNRMKIIANMSSDRSLNPLSAMHNATGVIAASITDTVMQGLVDKYLGETTTRTHTSSKT